MTTTAPPDTWSVPPEPEPEGESAANPSAVDTHGRNLPAFVRGRPDDPAWVRPALLALLLTTTVLYVWGLGASGWANSFYSAAVQAGTKSWKAFFFGSSDAANFITVDKSPAFLWPMEISARIFGVSSWSILVPQALEGVAAVGVLYLAVRRWSTPFAGLLAGAVLAATPVAALMFRFNNPDALLVLLLTLAAYATVRAIEHGSMRWVVLVGVFVGFAFLAKMLQALLVVPGFGLAYLVAAPGTLWRRVRQLAIAGVALLVSAGWWVAAVALTPASMRPYVGGSSNNSIFDLIFGYNGFGRLSGNESGSVGGFGQAGGRWGPTGWGRLFNAQFGGDASWLLPAALILLAAGLAYTWRRARTDRTRASLLVWGGWLLVTGAAISFGQGIIHPYYTVALAPAIGALVGIGVAVAWRHRDHIAARALLALALVVTVVWAAALLHRTPTWHPELRGFVLVLGIGAAAVVLAWPLLSRHLRGAVASVAIVAALAAPIAYTLETVNTPHAGAIPSAGPASAAGFGPGGGFRPGFVARGGLPGGGQAGNGGGQALPALPPGVGGGLGGLGGGNPGGRAFPGFGGGQGFRRGGAGGLGGLLDGSTVSSEVRSLLEQDASRYRWVAAAIGSNRASGYQLATGKPVMAIGGFNGTDPAPTLAQFEQYVRAGKIHYFIGGGGFGGGGFRGGFGGAGGTSDVASQITSWVEQNFTARTVGGVTLYDLSAPASGSSSSSTLTG